MESGRGRQKGGCAVKARELTRMAMCVTLICVCAWITLPTSVPFTMQTFAVCLTLSLMGGRRGVLAILAYLLLGAAGVPVFSGGRGGLGILLGSTGGYMAGFVAMGLIYWGWTRLFGERLWAQACALALGLAAMYALGTVWFVAVGLRAGGEVSVAAALSGCVWPFVAPDLIKLALALLVSRRLPGRPPGRSPGRPLF